MIDLGKGRRMVEPGDELPDWTHSDELFVDFETTSFDRDVPAIDPFNGHRICGAAVKVRGETALYLPMRHTRKHWNYDLTQALAWLREILRTTKRNTNHNIKFDVSFAHQDDLVYGGEWCDTLTFAKVIDSDQITHSLKPFCRNVLGMDLPEEEEIKNWLKEAKSKNYGDVPADMMAKYACMDVNAVEALVDWCWEQLAPEMKPVWDIEQRFTPVLWDMEVSGLRPDPEELLKAHYVTLRDTITLNEKLDDMIGQPFVNSSKALTDLFINQLGLPVLAWGKSKITGKRTGPSFAKDVLLQYKALPQVASDPKLLDLVTTIMAFRKEDTFRTLFVEPFIKKVDDYGVLHPRYNQLVRTGRTSSSNPNSQQMNGRAKQLIVPGTNYWFMSMDASQIEFRLIVDLIEDPKAMSAYLADPRTDFHQWVADLCEVGRRPGKTLNFAMGYGAGKATTMKTLAQDDDIIAAVNEIIIAEILSGRTKEEHRADRFAELCTLRSEHIYYTYHERLPGLKPASNEAARVCRSRGYSRNPYGGRRTLPTDKAHLAFNTITQGWAMYIIKEGMNRTSPRYNSTIRDAGITHAANVHDEVLFCGPGEAVNDPKIQAECDMLMSTPSCPITVPIVWDTGTSEVNWKKAIV